MSKKSSVTLAITILLALLISMPAIGCSNTSQVVDPLAREEHYNAPLVTIPYILPSYYQAIEVLPVDLENAYYSAYGNHAEAEFLYTGKSFIFKNVLVDAWMIRELDKGWIWADMVKCPVTNLDDAKRFHPGDRIDIIGICMGRNLAESPGLVFKDCIVIQSGSVQIPAPGSSSTFSSGY
jgi:hypothetical protein